MLELGLQLLLSLTQLEVGVWNTPNGSRCAKSEELNVVCQMHDGTMIDLNHNDRLVWLWSDGTLVLVCDKNGNRAINCRVPESQP